MSAQRPIHAAGRVLIVEDSRTQALQLQHLLVENGLQADWVETAEEALERLEKSRPDLVITDLNLPGVSGEELCRRMRMAVNTRAVPVLLLTSEVTWDAERRALESGADDFVNKYSDTGLLLLRVQALLRKSQVEEVLASAQSRAGAPRVLVVDDSETYRQLLVGVLTQEGYQIKQAETGEQALALMALEAFDAVVLDLVLPDISGTDVCRRMAEARRTVDNACFVLALVGSESRQDMGELLAAGADDVISKSREMSVIVARLRALVRRKLLFDENRRISQEFQERERALLQERAQREVAEARAALVEQLERGNRELKETQAQLVQSAKMASLGQLVAGVAHEINNPTAFVIGHLETVRRLVEELAPEVEPGLGRAGKPKLAKIRQRLKDMGEGLLRVRDLVLKLRTFSRLDEGEFKPASVRENVEAVLTMLHHKTKGRIEVACHFDEPDVIECYPGLLNQALMNIVSNAADAIEGKGRIEIRSGPVDGRYEIAIRDSGKGIPAAARERIFEPFFTTKPVGEGVGLGMSITYQIVKKHGGEITVESEQGRGTRIVIRLPAASPRASEAGA